MTRREFMDTGIAAGVLALTGLAGRAWMKDDVAAASPVTKATASPAPEAKVTPRTHPTCRIPLEEKPAKKFYGCGRGPYDTPVPQCGMAVMPLKSHSFIDLLSRTRLG